MSESALRTARFADTRWSIAILKPLEQEQSWLHDLERAGWLAIFSNQPSSPGDKLPPVDELREEKGHIFTIKIKRGLSGFVNGSRTSALPDTGASENVVSVAFAEERQLEIKNNPTRFRLGNSKVTQSIGTVSMRWAFAEESNKPIDIICHVLPVCTYDLILGRKFLAATETLAKYRRRVTECAFSMLNVFHLNLLDDGHQNLELEGRVGDHPTRAAADTGAERNVMDLHYAQALGLSIQEQPSRRGTLQFADGTFQETVGQVDTTWTFASGLKIPITFEVLENCSADVILGEDVLWEHNVFQTYAESIQETLYEDEENEPSPLAPFSYKKKYMRKFFSRLNKHTHRKEPLEDEVLERYEAEERHRRDQWNHRYGFGGVNASPAEKEAEARRRASYNARIEAFRRRPPRSGRSASPTSSPTTASYRPPPVHPTATSTEPRGTTSSSPTAPDNTPVPPVIPSIPTAPTNTPVHPTATSTEPRKAPPIIPSIPTSPNPAPVYLTTTNARRTARVVPRSTAAVPSDSAPSDSAIIDRVRRGLRF